MALKFEVLNKMAPQIYLLSIWHPTFALVDPVSPFVHFRHFSADMAVKLDTLAAMLSDACFVGYLTRMHANNSQGSSCSSRSRGQSSWVRTPSRGRASKVPEWCGCGLRPVLKWSGTELNPDRPFYGCPKYNVSGTHFFPISLLVMIVNHFDCSLHCRPLGKDGVVSLFGQMVEKTKALKGGLILRPK
ncbi:hypothetical protein PIB30_030545 [Stylosanthes scabra]|uniref:Zinc finger GRF-type domain-containing protein n=1 Tax=Stylosanthes scabra TaxID=79078 RepID=A0ABU6RBW8_9FABA|nr:hypothetical protein [Stylosanthes scabra]